MTVEQYIALKMTAGVIATIGLYTVLFRENKLYRLFEHLFLGLAAGFSITIIITDVLKPNWWDQMMGAESPLTGEIEQPGYWLMAILLPIGLMGYFVFSRKHAWMSRIPIGIILGLWSGQQIQVFWNRWGPQIYSSMLPVIPNRYRNDAGELVWGVPVPQADPGAIYPSEALSNLIFVFTVLTALSYFFYSFDMKNRVLRNANLIGRWLLMIGFGAIFGSTVMARFALVIDRMLYVWIEWGREIVWEEFITGGGG